jgi:type I restriction enzyme S subunit
VLDGCFTMGSQHRISQSKFAELQRNDARPLDVLITVMATVGRVCVRPPDIEPAISTKHVYRITVDRTQVDPYFLMQALRGHPKVREQISHQTRGQTRLGINGQIVNGLSIAFVAWP